MRGCERMIAALLVAGLLLSACKAVEETSTKYNPATVEAVGTTGLSKVSLTAKAVERLGLTTAEVAETRGRTGGVQKAVPYAAVVYDRAGKTWVFTNREPLVYLRESITVDYIADAVAVLSEGPAVGTAVVTIGAAELLGAEFGIGK